MQACLRDIASWVLDCYNKASCKCFGFPVYIKVMFMLYCSLLSAQYIMSKKCVHTLISKKINKNAELIII